MDLFEAFALERGSIVSVAGASGNVRLVYGLAQDAIARGHSVVVTSTAGLPMGGDPGATVVEGPEDELAAKVASAVRPGIYVIATPGSDRPQHWALLSSETIAAITRVAAPDLILVKADGARGAGLKAPGAHEPPHPASATHVIICFGLRVLGLPVSAENVHRPERLPALVPCQEGDAITADMVVEVLTHEEGGRKNVPPGARLSALLDGPETAEHERLGAYIAQRLVYAGFERAVVATTEPWAEVRALVQ
jgi:molybdenum cofactor cytidylyltransferase